MAKRRMGMILFLLCFCLSIMPCYAQAASTTNAKAPISPGKDCTLGISYTCDDMFFPGQTVLLYKIADISADFQYTPTASFAASGLVLNGIQTNSEWNVIRSTLESLILAKQIAPDHCSVTDDAGQAIFGPIKPGLYLASAVTVVQNGVHYSFDSALISLPGLNTEGLWQYEVAIAAKPAILPPINPDEEITLKVIKLWKSDEDRKTRPKSIDVEIFRDGTSYQKVTLSEDNLWSYSWTAKNDGATWKVVERNVPKGYVTTVQQRGTTFVLTNTLTPEVPNDPTQPPKTGDTSNILLYILLLYLSGTMMVLLGITGKKKRHEETT